MLPDDMTIGSQQPHRVVARAEPSSSRGACAHVYLAGIIARLWVAIIGSMPVGYEDHTRFQSGVEFAPN